MKLPQPATELSGGEAQRIKLVQATVRPRRSTCHRVVIRFNPKARTLSDPYEMKYVPGTVAAPKPEDSWAIRAPGLVFSRQAPSGSVRLMKLPQ